MILLWILPSRQNRSIVFVDLFTKKISNQNLSPNFTGLNNFQLVKAKLLLFFIVISGPILGQKELKKELFPIGETQTGFRKQFVYKRQLIDNPLALQIPLLEAQDPVVSREFLIYKRQQSNIKWISGLTALLSFYTLLNKDAVSDGFYWSVVGGSAVANLYFGSVSVRHFRRALNRYNELANDGSKMSFKYSTDDRFGSSVGLVWHYKF